MKTETGFFAVIGAFFVIVAAYGAVTDWAEPVGWVALILCGGLGFMITFFLWTVSRKLPARPEDDEHGEIEQAEGRPTRPSLRAPRGVRRLIRMGAGPSVAGGCGPGALPIMRTRQRPV